MDHNNPQSITAPYGGAIIDNIQAVPAEAGGGQPSREMVHNAAICRSLQNSDARPLHQSAAYTQIQNHYKEWCTARRLVRQEGGHIYYLTRENVDLYFTSEVVDMTITPDSIGRIHSALQKYADDV
jgi:hypothetical protein